MRNIDNENITDALSGSAAASVISMEDSPTDNIDTDTKSNVVQSELIQTDDRHVAIKCVDKNEG